MVELLTTYTGTQIVVFIFIIAVAVKELLDLISYFVKKTRESVLGASNKEKTINDVVSELQSLHTSLKQVDQKVAVLMESDKDHIKSWIVQQYRYFQKRPEECDDFYMDCLEKGYSHYKDEGGNSYIENVMEEIRKIHNNNKGG